MRGHEAHWRSLEGRGWKSRRRRRSRPDGLLIICSRCARTDRPFALAAAAAAAAALLPSPRPAAPPDDEADGGGGEEETRARGLRWRMQRKEPGWLVGEQRQASFGAWDLELDGLLLLAMSDVLSTGRPVRWETGARRRGRRLPGVSGAVALYARAGGLVTIYRLALGTPN
ncbi:hypothetical protein E2562_002415 [Oryza meyeriana var. granulata]|uniref:Uncharacterized protein n=1 Tax=Oryza meyeriana var. granulata TaxID=110450 RepID=A0A6G1F2E7_9ORYZ|nr:hypothetical protein E2562_002415 [Oryza meyeriana var. granulata]